MVKIEENPDVGKIANAVALHGDDEEILITAPKVFMRRNFSTIPCFRETFLYSITGSLFVGVSSFMLTSNTRKSINLAAYSLSGLTMLIWFACRVNMVNEKFKVKQLQTGVQDYIEKLGTKAN